MVKQLRYILKDDQTSDDEPLSGMLGRMSVINLNPHQSELYFLRILLYHRPCQTGFTNLRTVNNEAYKPEAANIPGQCLTGSPGR